MTANILKIRRKPASPRRGIPKAIAYTTKIFDPASDLEAMIEAYGPTTVKAAIDAIVNLRAQLSRNNFNNIRLVASTIQIVD